MKKALALILSLMMVLAMVPFALAEGAVATKLTDAPAAGDQVVIYYPAGGTLISSEVDYYESKDQYRLAPVEASVVNGEIATIPETALVLDVAVDGDGYLTFTDADGKYLTSGETGNNLTLEDAASDYSLWALESAGTDGDWYIKSVNAQYNGKPQYIEYFYAFTTFGFNSGNTAIYTFQFFKVGAEEETEPTEEPTEVPTEVPTEEPTPGPSEPAGEPIYFEIKEGYTDDLMQTMNGKDYLVLDIWMNEIPEDDMGLSWGQFRFYYDADQMNAFYLKDNAALVKETVDPFTGEVVETPCSLTTNIDKKPVVSIAFASDYGLKLKDGPIATVYFELNEELEDGTELTFEVKSEADDELFLPEFVNGMGYVYKTEGEPWVDMSAYTYEDRLGPVIVGSEPEPEPGKDIVILFTNDVHCGIEEGWGYAGVAAYKKEMAETADVILVDTGDHIQGGTIGTLTTGSAIIEIMNQAGYDVAVPGNHEFDYGMDRFWELVDMANYPYVSANFNKNGAPCLDQYEMFVLGEKNVAIVGLSTPETLTKSTPTYFQDENGNWIYDFCQETGSNDKLVKAAQDAIDAAREAGADYVIVVGHMGIDEVSEPYTSRSLVKKLSGLDAFIDGHSHSTIEAEEVEDKDGNTVLLGQTGTKLANIGKLTIAGDGTLTMELIPASEKTEDDAETKALIDQLNEEFEELLAQVVAHTDYDLVTHDPEAGNRIVRSQETNLGDLCADAYRVMLGADIAFVNGGGVRAEIPEGDITYEQIINVHPFGNEACLVEVTGQQILDALEWGAQACTGELGGFLQVSGISFTIDTTIPTSVTKDEAGMFTGVAGERRVKDVMVGDEPIDPEATYKLASHNYMLKNQGDGFAMFGTDNVTMILDCVMVDNQVLMNYLINELGGEVPADYADPYGQGRITILTAEDVADDMLDEAIEYAEDFIASEAFEEISEELQAEWEEALADAIAVREADPEASVDEKVEAAQAIYGLSKTGESMVIYVFAGIAIVAMLGMAAVALRRKFN